MLERILPSVHYLLTSMFYIIQTIVLTLTIRQLNILSEKNPEKRKDESPTENKMFSLVLTHQRS